jgi:hypothetical protein
VCKINGDHRQIDLSEKAFIEHNAFDINPLIFYRLSKPLKPDVELPELDLSKFYRETTDYGVEIEIRPDLIYEKNDFLIEQTQTQYNELIDNINKFPTEFDHELLREMDRYVNANLSDKKLQEIKAKDDFKIADMTFQNP